MAEDGAEPYKYYCPEGTTMVPLQVADVGFYTVPDTNEYLYNREAILPCPDGYACANGVRSPQMEWTTELCRGEWLEDPENVVVEAEVGENFGGLLVAVAQQAISNHVPVKPITYVPAREQSTQLRPLTLIHFCTIPPPSLRSRRYTLTRDDFATFAVTQDEDEYATIRVGDAPLDYEVKTQYRIDLVATVDDFSASLNCSFVVNVKDTNDPPTIIMGDPPKRNVTERSEENTPIGSPILVTDPDTLQEHFFKIESVHPAEGLDLFTIGGCSGQLFVASNGIDYNTCQEYNLTISVVDDGHPDPMTDQGNITITVENANDAPYFVDKEVSSVKYVCVWGGGVALSY